MHILHKVATETDSQRCHAQSLITLNDECDRWRLLLKAPGHIHRRRQVLRTRRLLDSHVFTLR